MVRGIDIQNVVANSPHVSREQQIAQYLANLGAAHAAQEGQKAAEEQKQKVHNSRQSEQEQSVIDPHRQSARQGRNRIKRKATSSPDPVDDQDPDRLPDPQRGRIIDTEA